MKSENNTILIVQRFFYNFREGFFDYLYERNVNFRLINSAKSLGRVTVHATAGEKSYYNAVPKFSLGKSYIIFPFLFFHILRIRPKTIISEGGQNTVNNLQVLLAKYILGIDYIIWDLGKGYDEFPENFLRKVYMFFYKLTLRQAAFIYTYNTQGKEYFISLGMNAAKILVLNNTADTRRIKLLRAKNYTFPAELERLKDSGQVCFIFVGALLPSKNIEDLKELLDLLGNKYTLILVGDGESTYREKLNRLFENTNTIFTGYKKVDELAPYYNMASFAILPGLGGLSINQAMAFGLPVVCRSADGAEKDLVTRDKTGYIYASLPEAADYIKSKTSADWKSMGQQAENLLFTEHSIENMTDKFLSKVNRPI